MHRLLDQYRVVLLDMHGTFMFDIDRFGPEQDYAATYRRLGGTQLDDRAVNQLLTDWFAILLRHYDSDQFEDCFPSLTELLTAVTALPELTSIVVSASRSSMTRESMPPTRKVVIT